MSSSPAPGPTETPAAGEPAPEAARTPTAEQAASSGERWEWNQERYRDGVFSHAVATERERLTLLESVLDHHTRARFEALGLTTGHRVLEVGGGGGSVARWLAGQGAEVTVTDLDTTFLDELADEGVRVLRHDVYTEDFPPGSFDFIHARYVVIHLPDPEKALARLVKWLAPGGILVLEEPAFFPIKDSPHPAYRKVMRAFRTHLESAVGTDTEWARTFPVPFEGKGLGRIGYDARFQRIRGGDDEARWWQLTLEQTREAVVAEGLATDEEFAAAYADLDDPSFHDLSLAVFTAWGVKESGG
ncbi:class I SAM-dependent methyltransferase [Streptomyces rubiginosohelvolus]|uniref:class I SAM-dependent methyltransferase n=1 Tax=Streptomyces rubiginosohelvolus TaxID=67362 RepID=UPI0038255DCC